MPPALLLLGACAAPLPATSGTDEAEDTAAMVYDADPPEPLLAPEDVGALLSAVVALGAPDPDAIAEAYAAAMGEGGERCPGLDMDLYEPEGGCMTAEQTLFAGVGWYDVGETLLDAEGGLVELSWVHGGDYEILWQDGTRLAGGGELEVLSVWEDEATLTSALAVAGTWVLSSRADWLGQTMSAVYEAETRVTPAGVALRLTGGIGLGALDLFFDGFGRDPAGPCAGAPTGAIGVRDARGSWTRWTLGEDCDACGELVFHEDQALGELCLDLSDWALDLALTNAPH